MSVSRDMRTDESCTHLPQCNEDFGKVKALIIVRPGKEGADAQVCIHEIVFSLFDLSLARIF